MMAATNGKTSSQDELRILSVSSLEWRNGHEFALQALRLLKDWSIPFEFRLVGDGPFLEAVAYTRHELDLEPEVKLLLVAGKKELDRLYAWADIFVLVAVTGGIYKTVSDAQTMGLPVICTDVNGLKEYVADGVTGFVIPRRDPRSLAEKLGLLSADPVLRQKLRQASTKLNSSLSTGEL